MTGKYRLHEKNRVSIVLPRTGRRRINKQPNPEKAMGVMLDSHFLALTAVVTVSKSLAPPPLPFPPLFRRWRIYHCSHFGVLGVLGVRLGTNWCSSSSLLSSASTRSQISPVKLQIPLLLPLPLGFWVSGN